MFSTRKLKLILIIILGISVFAGAFFGVYKLGQKQTQILPTVLLDKTDGRCQTEDDEQNVEIWSEDSLLKFSGTIVETSPCAKLSASLQVKDINIFLTNEGYSGICIQCIGAIDFSGIVKGVSEGNYTVKIFLNAVGKTILLGQKKVTLK